MRWDDERWSHEDKWITVYILQLELRGSYHERRVPLICRISLLLHADMYTC